MCFIIHYDLRIKECIICVTTDCAYCDFFADCLLILITLLHENESNNFHYFLFGHV